MMELSAGGVSLWLPAGAVGVGCARATETHFCWAEMEQ